MAIAAVDMAIIDPKKLRSVIYLNYKNINEFSGKTGVCMTTVYKVLRNGTCTYSTAIRFAHALGCDHERFVKRFVNHGEEIDELSNEADTNDENASCSYVNPTDTIARFIADATRFHVLVEKALKYDPENKLMLEAHRFIHEGFENDFLKKITRMDGGLSFISSLSLVLDEYFLGKKGSD